MSNKKITIQKNTVQETLIIPLYARKVCTELYPALFQDKKSAEIIAELDYDFSEIDKRIRTFMGRFGALETAMRQSDLAAEVRMYLREYPHAAVVNMGCGLDQTGESCDNGTCKIYNLDFPEVIKVRNELFPASERVTNIACDLNDPAWFSKVDASEGVIFFAAGVFYYFRIEEVKKLFTAMSEAFPEGVMVFDTAGRKAVQLMIKSWVRKLGITDVNAYFYAGDINRDIHSWLQCRNITSRGYMLGYQSLKDPSVSVIYRLLAETADTVMKMKIVRITF